MQARILLCDDEPIQRAALRLVINRLSDLPMEIIAIDEAAHGKQALELCSRFKPHIVFLDLRMPVLGGLEAAAIIREQYPDIQIILLTAYDEFQFAQEAIRLGVRDYLLKPANESDLDKVLRKTMKELLRRAAHARLLAELKGQLEQAKPYIVLEYVDDLLNAVDLDPVAIEQKRGFLALKKHPEIVFLLELDDFVRLTKTESEENRQLVKEQVKLIIKRETSQIEALSCRLGGDRFAILASPPVLSMSDREVNLWSINLAERIRVAVNHDCRLPVTIGVGSRQHQPQDVRFSYLEAQRALHYKFVLGRNHTIHVTDIDYQEVESKGSSGEDEAELLNCLRLGNDELFNQLLEAVVDPLCVVGLNEPEQMRWRSLELFVSMAKVALDSGAPVAGLLEHRCQSMQAIIAAGSIGEIRSALWLAALGLLELVQQVRNQRHQRIMQRAVQHMQEHYHEPLSLESMAKVVYLSPFYFSHIFKEQSGMTFIEYLTSLRINEAKRLLKDTVLAIGLVSEKVGYSDVNYFSRVFKKVVGITPSKYREKSSLPEQG